MVFWTRFKPTVFLSETYGSRIKKESTVNNNTLFLGKMTN